MARKLFSLVGEIFIDNEKANNSIAKTEKKAGGVAKAFGKGVKTAAKWGAGIAVGAAAAGAAVFALAKKTSETTDRIDKMSQQLGFSREGFQEWEYVLSQNGVKIDSLGAGMKTLTNMTDDLKAGTKTATDAFGKLGLSMADLEGKSQEEIFEITVTALQGMKDETQRAAVANDLLGRSGAALAPLLNQSTEAVKNMKDQAQEMGLVLSDKTIDAGVNFTDTMDQLKRSVQGVLANALGPMLPVINDLAKALIKLVPELMAFIGPLIEKLVPVVLRLVENLIPAFIKVFNAIIPILDPLIDMFLLLVDEIFLPMIDLLIPIIESLMPVFVDLLQSLIPVLMPILKLFGDLVRQIMPVFVDLITSLLPLLMPFIELFGKLAEAIMPVIVELFKTFEPMLDALIPILQNVMEFLSPIIDGIIKVVSGVGSFVTNLFGGGKKDEVPGLAVGGRVTKSGMALVGEAGPEYLSLPQGATVTPLDNSTSNNMNIVANYNITDKETAEFANDDLVRKIQGRGLAVGYR